MASRTWTLAAASTLAGIMLFAAGCRKAPSASSDAAGPALAVHVAPVASASLARSVEVMGSVVAIDRAALAAKITGQVTAVNATLGRQVAAGDVLVEMQAGELDARLAQAKASLAEVSQDLAREESLVAKGASTADAVRTLKDRKTFAEAAVTEAETMLGYTKIVAPFAGVVTQRLVNPGDLATPGQPLLWVEGSALRVEAAVPESLPRLATGADVGVTLAEGAVTGRLTELSPAADPVARTRLAKIDLPAGAAGSSGQFARVAWPAGQDQAILLPTAALSPLGQMDRVFVVADGHAHLRLVKPGARHGDSVEILAGLSAGEQVVLSPALTLRDGAPVEVQP